MSAAIDIAIRSSLVLAVGLIATALLRKQPAALRHWLLAAALALACAQPLIGRAMPEWHVATISRLWAPPATGPVEVETTTRFELPASMTVTTSPKFEWGRYVAAAWLLGVGGSLLMLLAGMAWLVQLGARSLDAGDSWHRASDQLRNQLGMSRSVRIRVTGHPAMLVTWGVVSPVILLPAGAGTWPEDRIRIVLAHELAHLVRYDWLVQMAAEIVRATQWFNPLFWLACACLRRESEHACDDMVIESGIGGASYASHLVAMARDFSAHGRTWLPAPSIARPSTLERRVRAMLNPQIDRRPVSMLRRIAIAVLLFAIALPIAVAAQATAATSGRVTDPSDLPLPDAAVRLASINGDKVFEARTDATGSFQLADVAPGDYLLSVRYPGFSSQRQSVHLNGPVTFTMKLQPAALSERVTVTNASLEPARQTRTASAPPFEPRCGTTAVGGNLRPPMKLKDVAPRFKQAWADANQEGTVLLQALIGTDGRVRNVEVVSPGVADMEEEAIAAVTQWEFTPTYLNCQAIEVRMFVTVAFKLDR
jgi:TonB family protein